MTKARKSIKKLKPFASIAFPIFDAVLTGQTHTVPENVQVIRTNAHAHARRNDKETAALQIVWGTVDIGII